MTVGARQGWHKVRIYKEYHSVCPLVGIGILPTPLSPASEGLGESHFRRLEKKLSTLPTLWGLVNLVLWRKEKLAGYG
jgi:hypothetical protein